MAWVLDIMLVIIYPCKQRIHPPRTSVKPRSDIKKSCCSAVVWLKVFVQDDLESRPCHHNILTPTYPPCTLAPPGSPGCPSAAGGASASGRRHESSSCRRSARRWSLWAARRRLLRYQWSQAASGRCQSRYGAYLGSTPDRQLGSTETERQLYQQGCTGIKRSWYRETKNIVQFHFWT